MIFHIALLFAWKAAAHDSCPTKALSMVQTRKAVSKMHVSEGEDLLHKNGDLTVVATSSEEWAHNLFLRHSSRSAQFQHAQEKATQALQAMRDKEKAPVVTASAFKGIAFKAFDGITDVESNYWQTNPCDPPGCDASNYPPDWIQMQFPSAKMIGSYKITGRLPLKYTEQDSPRTWILQGSHDGSSFTDLDSRSDVTGWDAERSKTFEVTSPGNYPYYRLKITDTGMRVGHDHGSKRAVIAEIKFRATPNLTAHHENSSAHYKQKLFDANATQCRECGNAEEALIAATQAALTAHTAAQTAAAFLGLAAKNYAIASRGFGAAKEEYTQVVNQMCPITLTYNAAESAFASIASAAQDLKQKAVIAQQHKSWEIANKTVVDTAQSQYDTAAARATAAEQPIAAKKATAAAACASIVTPQVPWVKTGPGEKCSTTCASLGKTNDMSETNKLTTAASVTAAFQAAGYTCMNVGGHRSYGGTPFSTGRSTGDCFYVTPGKTVVDKNNVYGTHVALCYCTG